MLGGICQGHRVNGKEIGGNYSGFFTPIMENQAEQKISRNRNSVRMRVYADCGLEVRGLLKSSLITICFGVAGYDHFFDPPARPL